MTNRYLMCAPDHFEVAYVINPWMAGNIALSRGDEAQRQWQTLANLLAEVAQIDLMTPREGVPDLVFTANAGLVLDNKVVLSHFRHVQRQAEEPYFAEWFAQHGFDVLTLPPDIWFEGAGDALLDRQSPLLWLAHGHRSGAQCARLLTDLLDIEIEPLRLVDDRFYHLDTCFCPLEGGYLMYYPAAFDPASQARIATRVPPERRIVVSETDALHFACNTVNSGHHVFLNKTSKPLADELESRGFLVRQTALTEFMKAGGSAKCLTLKLNEKRLPSVRVAD